MSFSMAAALMAAAMSMVMMIAVHVRVISQVTLQKSLDSVICISGNASVKSDTCFSQSILCSAAYAATDKHIYLVVCQKSRKGSMTASICIYNMFCGYLAVLGIVYLKLLRMAEVLKNLSVFVSHCYSHNVLSSLFFQNSFPR